MGGDDDELLEESGTPATGNEREMERIDRELKATEHFLQTGRVTDYLIDKEEDPYSTKATFWGGFQRGCPLSALSLVIAVGALPAVVLR